MLQKKSLSLKSFPETPGHRAFHPIDIEVEKSEKVTSEFYVGMRLADYLVLLARTEHQSAKVGCKTLGSGIRKNCLSICGCCFEIEIPIINVSRIVCIKIVW